VTPEVLRRLPLLADVPDDELLRLAPLTTEITIEPGTCLMAEGSSADAVYVVLEGEFEVTKRSGEREVQLSVAGPGEVLGELAVVADRPRSATVTAQGAGRVLEIQGEGLRQLLASPVAAEAILRAVMRRLENQEAVLRQHAKMASLGTLTAGLLHDLNNPAAAVSRGVARLPQALADWRAATAVLARADADFDALAGGGSDAAPDPLTRSDLTADLEEWLADRGVEDAWAVSTSLADLGWEPAMLEAALADLPAAEATRWLALTGELDRLLAELGEGARRISEIVASVKDHSRAEESAKPVDLHEGLESTLVLLGYRLREGVDVVRDYAEGPLVVDGYPGELNQVWSNLIDNAIAAMDGRGELVLRTRGDDDGATVEVIDNGCGIPEDVRDRIFEPFFTTKPVGQGSGIGLATVFRIVTQLHRGAIDVDSKPGRTVFTVRLPRTPSP
jgi:signal transduction histidine kinase